MRLIPALWFMLMCKIGLHGVRRVERGYECHDCYQLRWKRGLSPAARVK